MSVPSAVRTRPAQVRLWRAAALTIVAAATVAVAIPARSGATAASARQAPPSGVTVPTGGLASVKTYPAGLHLDALPEAARPAALAATSSYDPNRTADKYAEFQRAAALPLSSPGLSWKDVGPRGLDNPPGYFTSTEQFERVAGMASALAADPNDASGRTLYMGNMGGLWKSTDGGTTWANLSDGKIASAGVGAIALDPSRPGDLYVGTGIAYLTLSGDTYGTGFYVSHDGGATFSRPSPNVSGWAVDVIRVTPTSVLVGTNHGLYRSTDHGDSLTSVALPDNAAHTGPATGPYANWISDIAVRPGHPDEVTVAVGFPLGTKQLGDGTSASPGNGLYRSTANGIAGSFTPMDVSGFTRTTSSTDPVGRVSLAYGQTAGADQVLWAFVSDAGLAAGQGPTSTALAPQLGNKTGSLLNGLFRSDDDGGTWTVKVTPETLLTAPNSTLTAAAPLAYAPGVQAYYELWVATDPVIPDQVYFGLEEAYQTLANAGNNPLPATVGVIERYADICGFFSATPNVTNGAACPDATPLYGGYTTHPDQHAAVVVKTPAGTRLYSSNDGGNFRQDSHAITPTITGFDNNSWTDLNTLPTLEPWHVSMLPSGEILAALQDNGVSLSGADRKGVQVGLGDGFWAVPTADSNVFYIGVAGGSTFITKDHGHTLTEMQPNLTKPAFTSPFAVDPTDPNHLVSAARNVEESLKGPNTTTVSDTAATGTIVSTDWTQSFDAGTSPTTDPLTGKAVDWAATALDVRGAPAYVAMCATCSAAFETFDAVHAQLATNVKSGCTPVKGAADCWYLAPSKGLGSGTVGSVVIDPSDPRTVYASIFERQFVGYPSSKVPGRLYVSHDGAQTFTDITGNLPAGSLWRVLVRNGQLVAATDIGMFTAPMGGLTWSRLGSGLPKVAMRDAWIDPSGRYLLVSAYGRGVWMLDFQTTAISSGGPGTSGGSPNTVAAGVAPLAGLVPIGALLTVALTRRRRRAV